MLKSGAVLGCLGIERDPIEMCAISFKNGGLSYLAPEILDENEYSGKADIWYHCLLLQR